MDQIRLVAFLLSAGSAALFALVGRAVQRRPVSAESRSANVGFVTWWYGIAALTVVGAVQTLPGFPLDLRLFLVLTVLLVFVLCAALVGLIHYLVFLYTSRRNILTYLVVGYLAYFAVFLAFLWQSHPIGVEAERWGPTIEYERTIDSGPLYIAVIAGLLGPPLIAAAAYLRLYRVVDDRMLKRRILLVSLSILVWFGSSLVGLTPGAEGADWWRVTSRLIGMAAAATILYAFTALQPRVPAADGSSARAKHDSFFEPPQGKAARVQRSEAHLLA